MEPVNWTQTGVFTGIMLAAFVALWRLNHADMQNIRSDIKELRGVVNNLVRSVGRIEGYIGRRKEKEES